MAATRTARPAIGDRDGRVVHEGDFVQYHGSLTAFVGQIMLIKGIVGGRLWLEAADDARLSAVRSRSVSFSA